MARRLSDKTKQKLKMGRGTGKDYKPYVTTSEFNSNGTTSVIKDWKTGRGVHCLSQGEADWYYILRWDDNNVDIREQYPLDNQVTNEIAKKNGIKHPQSESYIMTIDFMVTEADGSLHAYSVKISKNSLSKRSLEILCIEKAYCIAKGIKYTLLFKEDVNQTLVNNIRLVTEFYDSLTVFDKYSAIKHKIAVKEYLVQMDKRAITDIILDELLEDDKE